MANYSAIKAAVNAYIKANGRKEITGNILNAVLNAVIDSLGRYFQFAGGAMPTDDPGTPDQNVCYLATEPGLYVHFGNIRINNEEVALLFWNGEWVKQTIAIGIQEVNASVDNNSGTPSVDVSYSQGRLVLTFHNLKGGKGDPGDPAGFGTIAADITGGVGTPGVSVETSGNNAAKNILFHFTNLKGEAGVTSVIATIDDTSGTPSCQVSLVNGVLTLAFSGLKGLKGDTGVSADYPITIYNGLDSNATDQALAAAQGKILDGKIGQINNKIAGVIIGGDAPNLFDIDNATARDNSSPDVTWSVSNGVLTMSTTSGTNVHLYINLQGTTAGKTYRLTAKITNANQPVIIRHSGTSSYDTMSNDGEDYSLTFVSTGEDWFDFLFRNRTITLSDVVLVSTEVSPKSVNPEYVNGLTLDNFTPETAKELSAFDDVFQPTFPTITPILTSGHYIKNDGTIGNSSPYSYTAPIHLDAGTVLTVTTAPNYDTSVVAIISETDSGATFYTPVSIGDGSGVHTYIAKREVYVALSFATANYSISAISSPLFVEIFGDESSEDYTYFLASIIGKYTALGDSLTAGHIFNSDAPSGYAYTDFTFPTIIGRQADAETDIAAIGGYTSKQLYQAAAELIDYENTNLFTIWLGTNDGYTLTSYADVNPEDGWENYPDTYVGAYCKLVDRIRETNPNAIVVLINIQSGGANGDTGCTLESTQATIAQIAEDRGLLCIDTSAYTRQLKPSWHGMNGGNIHFSIFGYQNLAKIFMSEIGAFLYVHPEIVEKVYALPAKKYTGVVRLLH